MEQMQVAIDGCKKVYSVNPEDEIKRIRAQKCMRRDKDFPKFMRYTHKIPVTKNGKDRAYTEIKKDMNRVRNRIDENLVCPMNWMQERLEKIQGASVTDAYVDIKEYMIGKPEKAPTYTQMNKIRKIIEDYDAFTKRYMATVDFDDEDGDGFELLENKSEEVFEAISTMSISLPTMYRLIEVALGYEGKVNKDKAYKKASKYSLKTLNVLYKASKEKFMSCFSRA